MTATMLADRSLLRISGDDVRGFLQGLLTNDVSGQLPIWSGLLTPQGKVLFDFMVWPDGDAVLIDCERDARETLARRLSIYRLRRAIAIEPVEGFVHWSHDAGQGSPDPRLAALGHRWVAGGGVGIAAGVGVEGATTEWLAHRLSLGVTEGRAELGDGETLWLEANAHELHGVSFAKGCYVGQENTARMHHRAKVNRRLVVAPLGNPGDRARTTYPDLGLMVDLRRVGDLGDAIVPAWLSAALESRLVSS